MFIPFSCSRQIFNTGLSFVRLRLLFVNHHLNNDVFGSVTFRPSTSTESHIYCYRCWYLDWIRARCKTEEITKWIKNKNIDLSEYIERMIENVTMRIARHHSRGKKLLNDREKGCEIQSSWAVDANIYQICQFDPGRATFRSQEYFLPILRFPLTFSINSLSWW